MKTEKKNWKKIAKQYKKECKELGKIIDTSEDEYSVLEDRYKRLVEKEGYDSNFLKEDPELNKKIAFLIYQTDKQMNQSSHSKEVGLTTWLQNRSNYFITYLKVLKDGGTDLEKFTIEKIDKADQERKEALDKKAKIEAKYNKLLEDIKSYPEISTPTK